MKLIDAHCHLNCLDLTPYDGKLSGALNAARRQGIEYMLSAGITIETFPEVLQIARENKDVGCAVGVQPGEMNCIEPSAEELAQLAGDDNVIGIGETGLEYHYCEGDLKWQRERFRRHIRAACAVKKPLIIHIRDAEKDAISILKEENAEKAGGMLHCFTGAYETAKKAMDLGFYISFSGIVTFNRADNVRAAAKKIPLDAILIETDSPYLAPVPLRGKSNEPAYLVHTAKFLANFLDVSVEEFADRTIRNFRQLFYFS